MSAAPISRYPVPDTDELPQDIMERILAVQEKSGFVPNVFLTLAHRPDEFRAFFAYHDALMEMKLAMRLLRAKKAVIAAISQMSSALIPCPRRV